MPKRKPREADPGPIVTFVLDENFGSDPNCTVANALGGVERVRVEMLTPHHFPRQTPDHVWIPEVTRRGWVILTKDGKIRRRLIEVEAWMNAGAAVCVLTQGDLSGPTMGEVLGRALPVLRRRVMTWTDRPLIVCVSAAGNVYVKYGRSPRGNRRDYLHLDDAIAEAKALLEGDEDIDEGRRPHPAHPRR